MTLPCAIPLIRRPVLERAELTLVCCVRLIIYKADKNLSIDRCNTKSHIITDCKSTGNPRCNCIRNCHIDDGTTIVTDNNNKLFIINIMCSKYLIHCSNNRILRFCLQLKGTTDLIREFNMLFHVQMVKVYASIVDLTTAY